MVLAQLVKRQNHAKGLPYVGQTSMCGPKGYCLLAVWSVINSVRKISDFGHKQGKGFGKRAAHHLPVFSWSSPSYGANCNRRNTVPHIALLTSHMYDPFHCISLGNIPVNSGATFGTLLTGTATFSMEELQKVD